ILFRWFNGEISGISRTRPPWLSFGAPGRGVKNTEGWPQRSLAQSGRQRARVFNFGVCTKPSPYGWNPSIMLPNEKANDAINIVRAVKAAKITVRLNLHIRRSYACAQSISPLRTGLRPTAPSNPLPFTPRSYQTSGCGDERQG